MSRFSFGPASVIYAKPSTSKARRRAMPMLDQRAIAVDVEYTVLYDTFVYNVKRLFGLRDCLKRVIVGVFGGSRWATARREPPKTPHVRWDCARILPSQVGWPLFRLLLRRGSNLLYNCGERGV